MNVNLDNVRVLINDHKKQIEDIEQNLPVTPIDCGLFSIEVVSVRELLLSKHRQIVDLILKKHAGYCDEITANLEEEYAKILARLAIRPENVGRSRN